MSLSVRTRFEVFKRDRFTCAYCGKHPPEALLEVDHVLPIAAGGTDDMANLITACWECNHGKAARLLEEGTGPAVSREVIDDANERIEQARAYAETVRAQQQLLAQFEDMVTEAWANAFGAIRRETERGTYWEFLYAYNQWPDQRSIRNFLRRLPVAEVLDAVDRAGSRFDGHSTDGACRYFYGICWGKIRDRESSR